MSGSITDVAGIALGHHHRLDDDVTVAETAAVTALPVAETASRPRPRR